MMIQCCVCQKIRQPNKSWIEQSTEGEEVSHTYCPLCLQQAMADVKDVVPIS